MSNTFLVSIIITNWNGKKHLLDCLVSLEKLQYKSTEIILVDNGSVDNSIDAVYNKFPQVKVVANKTDLGFCIGNNIGFNHSRGNYVLFLNNDTVVKPNFLNPLVERLKNDSKIGIVQPKIIFKNNKKLQSGAAFLTATGLLYYFGYGKNPEDSKYSVPLRMYSANGACMLVKREVIKKVGLFDESFFSYFEETDFCHRAQLAGYEVWYEPGATIYHIGSADNKNHQSSYLVYNSFRNRITSYLKNFELITLLRIMPIHILLCLLSFLVYLILRKPENSKAVIMALFYNISNFPLIHKKRQKIQQEIRRINDKQFLNSVIRNPRINYYPKLFTGLEKYND